MSSDVLKLTTIQKKDIIFILTSTLKLFPYPTVFFSSFSVITTNIYLPLFNRFFDNQRKERKQ